MEIRRWKYVAGKTEYAVLKHAGIFALTLDGFTITYIGGPTVLLETAGLRLLTDPTFDPAGSEYQTAVYTLHKLAHPAIEADAIGRIDCVLLSHDHHFDNLDRAGRSLLQRAGKVFTTRAGAERLGGNAVGLEPWQSIEIPTLDGRQLQITATPARHGPPDGDRGPVIGFVLRLEGEQEGGMYISGDTVLYEGVEEVAQRFNIGIAMLFTGAARVKEVGPQHLTMTAEEAAQAASLFPNAKIVPLHFEGWAHFSESRAEIENAFSRKGIGERLYWLEAGPHTRGRQQGRGE